MPGVWVRVSEGDHRLTSFKQSGGILSKLRIPFKPGHVALFSFCKPAEEGIEVDRPMRFGKTDGDETQVLGK